MVKCAQFTRFLVVVTLVACAKSEGSVPETLGKLEASVIHLSGQTTVADGTPSTRAPSCTDRSLPDQCGTWDGVELAATLTSGEERCLRRAIDFVLPASIPVSSGNAGKHKAALSFRKESGAIVECRYK